MPENRGKTNVMAYLERLQVWLKTKAFTVSNTHV